jgi:hypothetical protein
MESVVFASFERPERASAAAHDLRKAFLGHEGIRVRVHSRNEPSSDLDLSETHARAGAGIGAVAGGFAGMVAGLLSTLAVGWTGMDPALTVFFCTFVGVAMGLLAGILVSPTNPDITLNRMEESVSPRGAVITVEAGAPAEQTQAMSILRRYTSDVELKPHVLQPAL